MKVGVPPAAAKLPFGGPWAMAAPGCWNRATRLAPSELVVIWRTPTMDVVQVVGYLISTSSWLAATAGRSERLYLAPSHCEPDSQAQGAWPAVMV